MKYKITLKGEWGEIKELKLNESFHEAHPIDKALILSDCINLLTKEFNIWQEVAADCSEEDIQQVSIRSLNNEEKKIINNIKHIKELLKGRDK